MQRFRAVWSDGYITTIIKENNFFRLEGNKRSFENLELLAKYYKGEIKTISEE